MRSVHDRNFMAVWHQLLSLTNAGVAADNWQVDEVKWVRHRHSFWADRYSFQIESHTLDLVDGRAPRWSLWVIIERWWQQPKKDAVRSTEWCRVTAGDQREVLRWFSAQAKKHGLE